MDPVEAGVRAACAFMGADPETWEGFRDLGLHAARAFVDALPPDLAARVREHLPDLA